jgi:ribosome-associated heat shock protein Hsp15
MSEPIRVDKWLWAARFFKTRSLATDAIDHGRVKLNGLKIKPAKTIQLNDLLDIDNGSSQWQVKVIGLSGQRGSATLARQLYTETEESIKTREQEAIRRALFPEPSADIKGRPTKRDRRLLDKSRD